VCADHSSQYHRELGSAGAAILRGEIMKLKELFLYLPQNERRKVIYWEEI
jgi:hypothetical protein